MLTVCGQPTNYLLFSILLVLASFSTTTFCDTTVRWVICYIRFKNKEANDAETNMVHLTNTVTKTSFMFLTTLLKIFLVKFFAQISRWVKSDPNSVTLTSRFNSADSFVFTSEIIREPVPQVLLQPVGADPGNAE